MKPSHIFRFSGIIALSLSVFSCNFANSPFASTGTLAFQLQLPAHQTLGNFHVQLIPTETTTIKVQISGQGLTSAREESIQLRGQTQTTYRAFKLPPGEKTVTITATDGAKSLANATTKVNIESGKTARTTVELASILEAVTLSLAAPAPLDLPLKVTVTGEGIETGKQVENTIQIPAGQQRVTLSTLPPGAKTFSIQLTQNGQQVELLKQEFTIEKGSANEISLSLEQVINNQLQEKVGQIIPQILKKLEELFKEKIQEAQPTPEPSVAQEFQMEFNEAFVEKPNGETIVLPENEPFQIPIDIIITALVAKIKYPGKNVPSITWTATLPDGQEQVKEAEMEQQEGDIYQHKLGFDEILHLTESVNEQGGGRVKISIYMEAEDAMSPLEKTYQVDFPKTRTGIVEGQETPIVSMGLEFSPNSLQIKQGTAVTWENRSPIARTILSIEGLFEPQKIAGNSTFSFTFQKPGEYHFRTALLDMKMIVIVK